MKSGQSLSSLTAKILLGLEGYFESRRPDIVIGHGDTTTCFASALSSFYHKIPFLHVEAGLRTFSLETPFPEEFNRQSVAPLAFHHFAPTELERKNLISDGIKDSSITVTGTTVHEAVNLIQNNYKKNHNLPVELATDKKIITVTLHRRESLNSLNQTLEGVRRTAESRNDLLFICPVHPNPKVRRTFKECLIGLKNVRLLEPLDYPSFISLLTKSDLILTDSGGVQEEGAFLGKRTLLARSETERFDGIKEGLVSLIGTSSDQIFTNLNYYIDQKHFPSITTKNNQRYATDIITDFIERIAI